MISSETISQVAVWKNSELQRYCVAFVARAVELLDSGVFVVGSDDVSEPNQPESHSIPGSAIAQLLSAHVIQSFFGSIPAEKIYGGRRMSKRESANGRKISLYRLTSRGMAEEYLRRNQIVMEPLQLEMNFE